MMRIQGYGGDYGRDMKGILAGDKSQQGSRFSFSSHDVELLLWSPEDDPSQGEAQSHVQTSWN